MDRNIVEIPAASNILANPQNSKSISGGVKKYPFNLSKRGRSVINGLNSNRNDPRKYIFFIPELKPIKYNFMSQSDAYSRSTSSMIWFRVDFLS